MADVTANIIVSSSAVRALAIYTNNGRAAVMKATLEGLIDKWGKEYLAGALAQRKAAVQSAIDIDETKLATVETALGIK
jgi:hypothetical protein